MQEGLADLEAVVHLAEHCIGGHPDVLDFIDSKLNPNAARNATITACGQDFAMVGTSTSALTTVDDLVQCADQAGAATGLPDIPATNGAVEGCAPVAYPINPNPVICSTVTANPQRYQTNQGVFTYLKKKHPGLHGSYVYSNDTKAGAATGQVLIHASTGAGMHRRLIAAFEGFKYGVQMDIKSALKFPIEIIEVTRLPDLGGLMAGVLKTKPLNHVLDDESPVRSVYFKAVNVMVSIGGIIGAGHAPDRSTGESQCQGHRAIAASGLVCHFRHH